MGAEGEASDGGCSGARRLQARSPTDGESTAAKDLFPESASTCSDEGIIVATTTPIEVLAKSTAANPDSEHQLAERPSPRAPSAQQHAADAAGPA